jgi:inner membrane protein
LENLTHSLVGAAIAHAALDDEAPPPARRLTIWAGVAAANAPDLDLLYTGITSPPPIGYLLHHRGHTHTVVGLTAIAALIVVLAWRLPAVRKWDARRRGRLAVVIGAGLVSHLLLDAGNHYGVNPFFPVDLRWYYGDALFIFEPLIWLLLGGVLATAARSRPAGWLIASLVGGLSIATAVVGLVPWIAIAAIAAPAAAASWWSRRLRRPRRAVAALLAVAAFGAGMFAVSRWARVETTRLLPPASGSTRLDVVLAPSPALPLCWVAIPIDIDEAAGVLRLRRASISLAPRLWPASSCPFERFVGGGQANADDARSLADDIRVPLAQLRQRAAADCRLRAWLGFVRAPVIAGTRAYDLRFERPGAGNFTSLPLDADPAAGCPTNLPGWIMPRADAMR